MTFSSYAAIGLTVLIISEVKRHKEMINQYKSSKQESIDVGSNCVNVMGGMTRVQL